MAQNGKARTKFGSEPKVSIEFALAQLCKAHLHFHACSFMLMTCWSTNSYVSTVDNVLLFLDRFMERRGKVMEKREGWEEVSKYCHEALNVLRKEWQTGA